VSLCIFVQIFTMPGIVSCPVSSITVNENRVRIIATLVFSTSLTYLVAPIWQLPALLSVDFFLRIFGLGRYSPFNVISGWIVRRLGIGEKPTDQAPKIFAATLGFILAVLFLMAALFSFSRLSYAFDGILIVFSFLESALGICAGCHVYTLIKSLPAVRTPAHPAPAGSNSENSPVPR